MAEEDSISVSVPYYHYEFTMPWEENREATLANFLARAVTQATQSTPFARYSGLIRTPSFGLYLPGHPPLAMEGTVGSLVNPGSLVLILTDAESQEFLFREPEYGERPNRSSQLTDVIRAVLSVSQPTLAREQVATINALLGSIAQRAEIAQEEDTDDEEDERDEEYVEPPPRPANALEMLPPVTRVQPIMPDRVKKVINLETFNRVCVVMSQSEIHTLSTETCELQPTDIEDDTIGGPQDSGLGGCSVCLSLLINRTKAPGELRKMPTCGHIFHASCLQQWLTCNAITCPMCREPAVTEMKDYGYLGLGINPQLYTPASSVQESASHVGPSWIPNFPARS